MTAAFDVSPSSLAAASQRMQRCGEELATAAQALRVRLLGAGSPWGHDEAGTMFGQLYTECTGLGLESLAHLGELLGSIAMDLGQMSENMQATDQAKASQFDQIH